MLYRNNGRKIVLDDFDMIWKDKNMRDMLKGAIDNSKRRSISRLRSGDDDGIPNTFDFKGEIAFVSNLNLDKIADGDEGRFDKKARSDIEAVLSRIDYSNLRMSRDETLDLMENRVLKNPGFNFRRADGNAIHATNEDKEEVMDFLKKNKKSLGELSVRTLGKVFAIKKNYQGKEGEDWEKVAESMLVEGKQENLGVNERFDKYSDFVGMVDKGHVKSMIAYGKGGIGKSYTVESYLEDNGMEDTTGEKIEDPEEGKNQYAYYKAGDMSEKALYQTLYKDNHKLIVLDDVADSVLKSDLGQAILKGALDTTGDGGVSWLSSDKAGGTKVPKKKKSEDDDDYANRLEDEGFRVERDEEGQVVGAEHKDDVPKKFDFKGRVVFISNLPKEDLPQPIQSRALTVNAGMTKQEAVTRMKHVVDKREESGKPPSDNIHDATYEDVRNAVEHFDSIKDEVADRNFNLRSIDKMVSDVVHARDMGKGEDHWKKVITRKLRKGFYNELGSVELEGLYFDLNKAFDDLLEE
jgi:hypothetical protein